MFDNLTARLGRTLSRLTGKSVLTDDNIRETLREVRIALLDADVALPVVTGFIDQVRQRAVGQEVMQSLSPGQTFVGLVKDELIKVMGDAGGGLNLTSKPPAVVLLAGLQGSGKTSTVAKLARFIKEREKKRLLLASTDIYRPAAVEQLQTLADEIQVEAFPVEPGQMPLQIAQAALAEARRRAIDVLIVDTAGRLAIDQPMMKEIGRLHAALSPVETLFVVDAMTGQDAASTAKAFSDLLPLTGVILTKVDGDARGGAALSVRQITGRPIKFLASGEKTDALEVFHPDRIAGRILGMGDVMSLIEEAERKIDREQADHFARKLQKGKKFDLADFRIQLQQMKNMGGMTALLDKLPGMGQMAQLAENRASQQVFAQMEAIIDSMTPGERRYPDVISGSRKRRIASGSGVQIQDINRLLKQHRQMQKMMKRVSKKGAMEDVMRNLAGKGGPQVMRGPRRGRR